MQVSTELKSHLIQNGLVFLLSLRESIYSSYELHPLTTVVVDFSIQWIAAFSSEHIWVGCVAKPCLLFALALAGWHVFLMEPWPAYMPPLKSQKISDSRR